MSIEFRRSRKPMRELPLAAMIDVVFILIFFFMLTTSFSRIESMELFLPSDAKTTASTAQSTDIILRGDNYIKFDGKVMAFEEARVAVGLLVRENPSASITLLVDDQVSMQRLVYLMDIVSLSGGQSLSVRKLAQ